MTTLEETLFNILLMGIIIFINRHLLRHISATFPFQPNQVVCLFILFEVECNMICVEIEQKRLQMLNLAKKYGMTAKVTVECSQELDKLLNLLQRNSH
jgi:hypothetical protein